MRLRTIGIIVGVVLFVIGSVGFIGINLHWANYDTEHNKQGGYLPGVNLSKADRDFRYNVGTMLNLIWFAGFGVLLLSAPAYMFDDKQNHTKR